MWWNVCWEAVGLGEVWLRGIGKMLETLGASFYPSTPDAVGLTVSIAIGFRLVLLPQWSIPRFEGLKWLV